MGRVTQRLKRRIAAVGSQPAAMGDQHPAGTAATPMVSSAFQLAYAPVQDYPWYTVATYQRLTPVWTGDGALVTGRLPGPWGGVYPAGRPPGWVGAR